MKLIREEAEDYLDNSVLTYWTIWFNYVKMMIKNNKRPLSFGRFTNHISYHCDVIVSDSQKSFIFGNLLLNKVFMVSHWSPSSMRDGYKLLKEIQQQNNIVVVFGCLDNMAEMFDRLGYYHQGKFLVDYPIHQEKTFYSSHDSLSYNGYNLDLSPMSFLGLSSDDNSFEEDYSIPSNEFEYNQYSEIANEFLGCDEY